MPSHTVEEREAALGAVFVGIEPVPVIMDQESRFFDFLQEAAFTAIDAFVGRQQVRQQQPAIVAPVVAPRPPISTNMLLIGAGLVAVVLFAVVR